MYSNKSCERKLSFEKYRFSESEIIIKKIPRVTILFILKMDEYFKSTTQLSNINEFFFFTLVLLMCFVVAFCGLHQINVHAIWCCQIFK